MLSAAEPWLWSGINPWHRDSRELSCFLSSKIHLQIISPPTLVQEQGISKLSMRAMGLVGMWEGALSPSQQNPHSSPSPICRAGAGKDPLLENGIYKRGRAKPGKQEGRF